MKQHKDLNSLELCLEYGIDFVDRRVYLTDEIKEETADLVIKGLRLLDRTPGTIYVEINSPGGSLSHMFAIYDAVRSCKQQVHTVGTGEIASAAGLILVSGDVRSATKNAWFMAHGIAGGVDDDDDILVTKSRVDVVLRQDKTWRALMAKHTSLNETWWLNNVSKNKKEIWFDAPQMKDHGIIDHVLSSENI